MRLYADDTMLQIFSEHATVEAWLRVEAALATGQAELGILPPGDAELIAAACVVDAIDFDRLWEDAANVGYPILPLVRQVTERLPEGSNGRVHLGATTQDIMDSGLALQLTEALDRLDNLLEATGELLCRHVDLHRGSVLAARTHGQQAVPTTLGAKFAVFLDELARHRERIAQLRPRACRLSLFGAGGTSAGYGDHVGELRRRVAGQLGLAVTDVPWHVARDGLAEFGFVSAAVAETCARLGREVIDLARTEIGEVREADGPLRGASSTMPQKDNPILAEGLVGLGVTASATSSALLRAMEAGHERAAGEWHVEWEAVPRVACLAAAALNTAVALLKDLRIDTDAMRRNLGADGGALMAEAYMMRLAPLLGRERAHELVYAAVRAARTSGRPLAVEVSEASPEVTQALDGDLPLAPEGYLGDTTGLCAAALDRWRRMSATSREEKP